MILEAETIAQFLPPPTRRLVDAVLIVFHQACDKNEPEAAAGLLRIAEGLVERRPAVTAPGDRGTGDQGLLAAQERLRRRPGGT